MLRSLSLPCITALFLVVLACLTACATKMESSTRVTRILWPPPPDKPQLEFISTYASGNDLKSDYWGKKLLEEAPALNTPFGIVSDGKGKVYVSDLLEGNIKMFDFDNRILTAFAGSQPIEKPLGMAMDDSGNIYVVEGGSRKVLVFATNGRQLRSFGGDDIMERPTYLAINNKLDRIYVSDSKKNRIAVFDRGGKHLFFIGRTGSGKGEFGAPKGLAVDRTGKLFVVDMLNARIQIFDPDGKFISAFGTRGDQRWQFESPRDIAVAGDGNLYILDHFKALLLTYTPEGEMLLFTGGDKRTNHQLGFSTPTSISLDSSDRIYITDQVNKRISVWQILSPQYLDKQPITQENLDDIQKTIEKSRQKSKPAIDGAKGGR